MGVFFMYIIPEEHLRACLTHTYIHWQGKSSFCTWKNWWEIICSVVSLKSTYVFHILCFIYKLNIRCKSQTWLFNNMPTEAFVCVICCLNGVSEYFTHTPSTVTNECHSPLMWLHRVSYMLIFNKEKPIIGGVNEVYKPNVFHRIHFTPREITWSTETGCTYSRSEKTVAKVKSSHFIYIAHLKLTEVDPKCFLFR